MYSDFLTLCIQAENSITEAAARMDQSRLGIVLVVDAERRLIGTVTDGDLRRAMLSHIDISQPVTALLERKIGTPYAHPVTAEAGRDPQVYFEVLREHSLLHLPLLDSNQRVAGLVTLDEFLPSRSLPVHAVIMAGGRGIRLQALTKNTPKPMLPVGDRPLMEIIVGQLREAGIQRVSVTTHYNAEKIEEHFGDGRNFGVEMHYVAEQSPLGTAGGIGLMDPPNETMLIMNGDILTQVDFRAMLSFHQAQKADLTVAIRGYEVQVPFGVIDCDGTFVRRLSEKPLLNFFVNAGIYFMEPSVHSYIPLGERCDMTDLIQRLLSEGRPVASFPLREYWLDIGQIRDYELAQQVSHEWKA